MSENTDIENSIKIENLQKQISILQGLVAQLDGKIASSWALCAKEEYEKSFRESYKQELLGYRQEMLSHKQEIRDFAKEYILKFLIGVIILLIGSGYVLITLVVNNVYNEKNKAVIADIEDRYNKSVDLDKKRYEWQRSHNNGKNLTYVSRSYLYLPALQEKNKEVIEKLYKNAEDYFREALKIDSRQASTYWELAELKYFYPKEQNDISKTTILSVSENEAIQYYERAIPYYTDDERSKGWKGDCYFRLAEIYSGRAKTNPSDKKSNLELAVKNYSDAKTEYTTFNNSKWDEVNKKLAEVTQELSELSK